MDRVDRGAPLTTTPLAVAGLLVLWGDEGVVTCVDAATGELAWRKRVGGTPIIRKPFDMDLLVRVLRSLQTGPEAATPA